jgi:ferredoxin
VDCFYAGKNMLVIHPDECIDCGVCEPECSSNAIKADTEEGRGLAQAQSRICGEVAEPNRAKEMPPAHAKEWDGVPGKLAQFSPNPREEQSGAKASPPQISKESVDA